VALLIAALLSQGTLPLTVLLLPILLIPQLLAALGLAWLMASLGVFLRDMAQFNQLLLQTWMYLTPIFYPEETIPEGFRGLVRFNPMAPLIRSYRRIILDGQMPDWPGLGFTLAFAIVCFLFGYWWFERTKKAFADVI
jgi:lipopolysaccharide transport system permease protein